ncbi:MAG: PA2778 family cysteine peptidase [Candidatus Omnitrophica bacterium]|nr:PA2778 family cysteine peptidase [Candidatus Omnitrophota bacterium]
MIKKIFTWYFCILFVACFVLGCACFKKNGNSSTISSFCDSSVLLEVPFVKQNKSYCGPAALSSVFSYWGKDCSQDEIAKETFQPQLKATLNFDLERFAKEKGFWSKGFSGNFELLKQRLRAGIPVIVIEKLHPFILNRYHYVVIVGIDDNHKLVIEHNGTKSFVKRSTNGFLRNWAVAGNWMLEIIPLEKAQEYLSLEDCIELAVLFEQKNKLEQAVKVYECVLKEHDNVPIALFNMANVYMKLKECDKAEEKYLKLIEFNPDFSDGFNNLAWVYLEKNNLKKAHEFADKALSFNSANRFYYLDTKARILLTEEQSQAAYEYYQKAAELKESVSEEVWGKFFRFWEQEFFDVNSP